MSELKAIDIRDVLKRATPGEWVLGKPYVDDGGFREVPIFSTVQGSEVAPAAIFLQFPNGGDMQMANAALICWLRNNVERLLADAVYALELREALEELLNPAAPIHEATARARAALAKNPQPQGGREGSAANTAPTCDHAVTEHFQEDK